MDLTKIDKPFGELDDATKGAMFAENAIYRVQPKPVIGEVVMHGVQAHTFAILSTPLRGQLHPPPCLTFTFPTRDGMHVPGVYTSPDGLQIKIEVAG